MMNHVGNNEYFSLPPFNGHEGAGMVMEAEMDYFAQRDAFVKREDELAFDSKCRAKSSEKEKLVDGILQNARREDESIIYNQEREREGYHGQKHSSYPGDHFLSNVKVINKTKVFKILSKMPKGAHLHIHFNSCLSPAVLLNIAKGMGGMFIQSTLPLIKGTNFENYDRCEITFSMESFKEGNLGNLFTASYEPGQAMKFSAFRKQFPKCYGEFEVDQWLLNKLLFEEQEAHHPFQTTTGIWEKFNGRTRMMKGLFNYETAFREYTRLCLEDFVRDNIQYAEIRPNFMRNNQLYDDRGEKTINNSGIVEVIIQEVEKFQKRASFSGLKIIYCVPRSLAPAEIKEALAECLTFKERWPKWIAGFDLVGEESKGRPLKDFAPQLQQFQKDCEARNVEIPFLFHYGETLDKGTEIDGNLIDALLLKAKRIGHGFALPNHPRIMEAMKKSNVCVELCPISNEILGLTPRVSGHSMYQLLAQNVHCTVNSDNGALFRSSLSHDFYQVLVGKADMGIYGLKQLVLWSIEHACLSEDERTEILNDWEVLWESFLDWVLKEYGERVEKAPGVQEVNKHCVE